MGDICSACQVNKGSSYELQNVEANELNDENKNIQAPQSELPKDPKQINESKREDKKKQISILTSKMSKHQAYKKLNDSGVLLAEMPDYSTPLTKAKKLEFGDFSYQRDDLEVQGAQDKPPMLFQNRYAYKGQWKNGQRNGRGTQFWNDGSLYEGYWKDNLAHGFGRLIHADGDIYEGQWLNDRANGKGSYYSSCGAKYYGDWVEDKQNGYGQEVWLDEAVYKGQYLNGKKHGKGLFLWEDDSSYEGEFYENNIHGYGKYIWRDGRTYEGEWKKNKMEGKGVFTWLDGRKYQGDYVLDRKEGFGIFYFVDGRVYQGEWLKGKQHGRGIFKKKGIQKEGIWENGERIRWVDEAKQNLNEQKDVIPQQLIKSQKTMIQDNSLNNSQKKRSGTKQPTSQ